MRATRRHGTSGAGAAAEQIAGASLASLSLLVSKSLLRRTQDGRYELHDLVRQYALEHLQEDEQEYVQAGNRHAHYYAALLDRRGAVFQGHNQSSHAHIGCGIPTDSGCGWWLTTCTANMLLNITANVATSPRTTMMNVLKVRVTEHVQASDILPPVLSRIERHRLADAANSANPRTFTLTQPGKRWEINGRVYGMEHARVDETVRLGDLEVWEIGNALNSGDTMHPNGMAHPFHIHGVQFQVAERHILPELAAGWQSVREGYVDEGWKDTVLLMPGERLKLLLKFTDFTGTFMYHCHILEHEDMGMMGSYAVIA